MRPKRWNNDLLDQALEEIAEEDIFPEDATIGDPFVDVALMLALRANQELLEGFPITREEVMLLKKAADPRRELLRIAEKIIEWASDEEETKALPQKTSDQELVARNDRVDAEIAKEFSKLAAKVLNELDKISKKLDEIVKKL